MMNYFKMKRQEWKLKSMVYGVILSAIDEQKDIIAMVQKLYVALKDVPVNEMQDKFISSLAEIIHAENKNNKEK